MAFFLIGILLAVGLLVLLNWWANAEVASAKRALGWAVVVVCLVLGFVLYARAGFFAAIVPSLFALWRVTDLVRKAKSVFGGQKTQERSSGGVPGRMPKSEALEVLGLEPGAEKSEINAAYKRLMAQCHPDRGGSDWMAAQLNEAKRTLLDERE